MNALGYFFEISDKMPALQWLYFLMLILGMIGFMLGCLRWWAGLLWLIIPITIASFQADEIRHLHDSIVIELGNSYVWHSFVAFGLGVLLNMIGITKGFIEVLRKRKLVLQ